MKKVLCLLLATLLALGAVPALAMSGDGQLEAYDALDEKLLYAFADGGRMMLVGEEGTLFAWTPDDGKVTPLRYELPELDENETDVVYPFAADGGLYAIRLVTALEDGEPDFGHTALYALTLEGDAVQGEKLDKLDWEDLVRYGEDKTEALTPRLVLGDGSRAWVLCDNPYGEDSYTTLAQLDIEDCELSVQDSLENIQNITPYRDGALLLLQRVPYGEENSILRYDPEEEEAEALCTFNVDFLSQLIGLAYDAGADTAYIIRNGEVCPVDLQAGVIGEGIVDMPLSTDYSRDSAFIADGVYVGCNINVASRALYDRPEVSVRLRVNDPLAFEAVKRFNTEHDTARVILTRSLEAQNQITENMMRQDDSIDVYVLDTSLSTYDAVFNRGFLMALDDSPAVKDLVGQMYPGIQEGVTREGQIQALPVYAVATALGVSEKALQRLGMTLDDIPGDWEAFLDFLPTLEEPLSEHSDVKLMEYGEKISEARLGFMGMIFIQYQNYISSQGLDKGYDEEPLRPLLDKLSTVDFEALGLLADDAEVEYGSGDAVPLFAMAASCMIGNFCGPDYVPLCLRLAPDMPAYMVLDCMMLCVNPFTQHADLALEFAGDVAECMPSALRAALIPAMNAPIRGAGNARRLQEQRETVALLEAQAEEADGANRQLAESNLEKARERLAEMEKTAWEVGPEELQWYRDHDGHLKLAGVNWLNNDYVEENFGYIMQYTEGKLSAGEMLAGLDKTTEMIRREGN